MNLLLFILSFLFASYAPTAQTTDDGINSNTTSKYKPGNGKGGKFKDGDYIIGYDIMP